MRDPNVTLIVVWALQAIVWVAVAVRRRGPRDGAVLLAASLIVGLIAFLAYPLFGAFYPAKPSAWSYVAGAAAIQCAGSIAWLTAIPEQFVSWRPGIARSATVALAVLLPLGVVEFVAMTGIKLGLIERYVPMETRVAQQTEDWRLAHIMSDDFREPDPLLLWRPVAREPYSRQRFKGSVVAVPKPAGTFRIMCYGDSNTDGPPTGPTWPQELERVLNARDAGVSGRHYEVVNAGVTGYSSYQGLRRFESDVGTYTPDLVLVSFGWNDPASAMGQADAEFAESAAFQALSPTWIGLRRILLRYQSYLVAMQLGAPVAESGAGGTERPRVDRPAYASNLRRFIEIAREHAADAVLLTRPYRDPTDRLVGLGSWRREVPGYNRDLLSVAEDTSGFAVDVQGAFEGRTELFVDECHFNPVGHTAMAELVYAELRALGALK